jgi:hypothetical protein
MDQHLMELAQRQCWEAWKDRHKLDNGTLNRYCKVLCDLPPPEVPLTAEIAIAKSQDIFIKQEAKSDTDRKQIERLPKNSSESIWPPMFALAILFLLIYAAQQLEIDKQGSGRVMLGWVFGLVALAVLVYINWGSSAKETGHNFWKIIKSVSIFVVVVLVLGGLGQCMSISRDEDTGGVPDAWSRR